MLLSLDFVRQFLLSCIEYVPGFLHLDHDWQAHVDIELPAGHATS